jgi:hypothetical protein
MNGKNLDEPEQLQLRGQCNAPAYLRFLTQPVQFVFYPARPVCSILIAIDGHLIPIEKFFMTPSAMDD